MTSGTSSLNNIPSNILSQLGGTSSFNPLPIGGFGPTGQTDSFESLFSSLNSSGTFGPSLYSNTGPAGANSQAMALSTETATSLTSALLNKIAPLNLPPEALYSSSVFGNFSSGMSLLDTLGTMASGIAGNLPLEGRSAQIAQMVSPALGALSGLAGAFQAMRVAFSTPPVIAKSSPAAIEEYQFEG